MHLFTCSSTNECFPAISAYVKYCMLREIFLFWVMALEEVWESLLYETLVLLLCLRKLAVGQFNHYQNEVHTFYADATVYC
jgi:hypothetical protein